MPEYPDIIVYIERLIKSGWYVLHVTQFEFTLFYGGVSRG